MRLNNKAGLEWIAAENDQVRVTCSTDQMTFKVESKDKSFRGRTFKGEMAWSKAQRYVDDHTTWLTDEALKSLILDLNSKYRA